MCKSNIRIQSGTRVNTGRHTLVRVYVMVITTDGSTAPPTSRGRRVLPGINKFRRAILGHVREPRRDLQLPRPPKFPVKRQRVLRLRRVRPRQKLPVKRQRILRRKPTNRFPRVDRGRKLPEHPKHCGKPHQTGELRLMNTGGKPVRPGSVRTLLRSVRTLLCRGARRAQEWRISIRSGWELNLPRNGEPCTARRLVGCDGTLVPCITTLQAVHIVATLLRTF